jgi:hypothetical protein
MMHDLLAAPTKGRGHFMDVASFLKKICDILADTTAREVDVIEFEADGRDVAIRVRREPYDGPYPSLAAILRQIGRSCLEQGVAVPQLSRIVFLRDEIRVELAGSVRERRCRAFRFPIEGALGPATPEAGPLLIEQRRSGGS